MVRTERATVSLYEGLFGVILEVQSRHTHRLNEGSWKVRQGKSRRVLEDWRKVVKKKVPPTEEMHIKCQDFCSCFKILEGSRG